MEQKSWLVLNNKFFFSKAHGWKFVSIKKKFSKTGSTKWFLIDFATSYSKKVIDLEMCFSKKKN
jgi:hypothetical protein